MTRLVIITNGNFFARIIVDRLFAERSNQIAGIVIVTGVMRDKSRLQSFGEIFRKSGWRYFLYKASTYMFFAAAALLWRKRAFFVHQLAKRYGTPVLLSPQVNEQSVVEQVREWAPDILISVSCPQRIKKKVLDCATRYAINIHSSLLPGYAGLAPYFWVLANGERKTGTTVHIMEESFDAGKIVVQKQLVIKPAETVFSLFWRLSLLGNEVLAEAVSELSKDEPLLLTQDLSRRSYYSLPTPETMRRLYTGGHTLWSLRDYFRAARKVN